MNKNLIVCRIKWEPLNQLLQNLVTTVNVANFEHFLEIPFSDTFVLNPM